MVFLRVGRPLGISRDLGLANYWLDSLILQSIPVLLLSLGKPTVVELNIFPAISSKPHAFVAC